MSVWFAGQLFRCTAKRTAHLLVSEKEKKKTLPFLQETFLSQVCICLSEKSSCETWFSAEYNGGLGWVRNLLLN